MSHLEEAMAFQFRIAGVPIPKRQYKAIPGRRFAWDFAWFCQPGQSGLLLEVQGGTFARGKMGHSTGMGQHRDFEKQNLAVLAGWRVLVVDEKMVKSGQALKWVQQALTTPTESPTL